ncbi:MAG: two-component system response regulator BaeR [Proteobacteria bacterium]|nr:two-component system response regulator BaeR [Pseudomonadota bacterium]
MKHVLIVEDEKKLADVLIAYLNQNQFKVTHFESGNNVVDWVKTNQPNIILLDLMLPDVNGKDLCKEIRQFSMVPIIMVTAMIDEIDRLIGLELGADDYVCKPFSPKEVVARVKAVLRRSEGGLNHGEVYDAFEVNDQTYTIKLHRDRLDLTPVEFRLLKMFLQSPGRVFNRDQILNNIFEDGRIVLDRTVDTHVKNLRHKLKTASPEHDYIRSVYGIGYSFEL